MKSIVLAFCVFLSTVSLSAANGVIVYKKSGCDYFIVETQMGFAVLEWYGGYDPDEGDTIIGNFESYGFKDVYIKNKDRTTRIWVDEYWLDKDDAIEKYFEQCD